MSRNCERTREVCPGRALRAAAEHPADIAEAGCPERRPAKQAGAEDAERDRDRQFALEAGKGRDRERHNAAADLDRRAPARPDWPRETSAAASRAR